MKIIISVLVLLQVLSINLISQNDPVTIGVIGLSHSHVHWVFNSEETSAYDVVGIVEPNVELAQRFSKQYQFSMDMVYSTIDELIEAKHPRAVTAFGDIYSHLKVVEKCAPKGIHVMVEKPLAVSLKHAQKMERLARKHNIHLITNYETTWYPTNHKAYELVHQDGAIGEIRKVIVRDGHKGPKKIGVNKEFLDWLTDPILNGGGAVTDFGCYGANLLTWMMNGEKPSMVTAVTQQQQAENNPRVDDEAIIILTYKNSNAIIQASWNWPIGRKDMEVYGLTGVVYADDRHDLRIRYSEGYDGYSKERMKLEERPAPYNDPFLYFSALINDEVQLTPFDLSSLDNNMIVMEILDAAIRSSKTMKGVKLKN